MDCAAIYHGDTYKSQLKKYFIRFFFFCGYFFLNNFDLFWLHSPYNRLSRISPGSLRSIKQLQIYYRNPSLLLTCSQMGARSRLPIIRGFQTRTKHRALNNLCLISSCLLSFRLVVALINRRADTDMMSCVVPSGHCRSMIFPSSNFQQKGIKKKIMKSSEVTNTGAFLVMPN